MTKSVSARGRYAALDSKRSGLITRCERYAELTLPHICPKDGFDEGSEELAREYSSVGAQLSNNLINKMMLAMFAPSRPFMRLDLPEDQMDAIQTSLKITAVQIREELAKGERSAVRELDAIGARPSLYELFAHLVVTGNCVRYMDGDVMRIIGVKNYVVRRNSKGETVELIIKDRVNYLELPEELHQYVPGVKPDEDCEKDYYRWWTWDGKRFVETQWIEDTLVPLSKYRGSYKREDMPAVAHCWKLVNGRNYGIGHVEDNIGDLEGVSTLGEAEVNGAILASEFRWLINPAGITRVEDFKRTRNGDGIPGQEGDVSLVVASEAASAVQIISGIAQNYIRRLGSAFLAASGMQRDAERVTAEEIRMVAQELETGLGGIYSRLAIDLQLPLAYWLLGRIDIKLGGDLKPTIVTGLDALSRNGDLEALQLFSADCLQFVSLPPEMQDYFKLDNLFSAFATGRGLVANNYVRSQDEVSALQAKRQQGAQESEEQLMAQEAALKKG